MIKNDREQDQEFCHGFRIEKSSSAFPLISHDLFSANVRQYPPTSTVRIPPSPPVQWLGSFLKRFPKTSSIRLKKVRSRGIRYREEPSTMGISRYTLYKYVKVDGTWRYCKAAYHDNGKVKPDIVFVDLKQALLEKHPEGRYYMSHNGSWIDAGTDALGAQRKRRQRLALDEYNRLNGKGSPQSTVVLPHDSGRINLAAAAEKYFANSEARGLDPETIRKYRAAVDPFVEHCGVT